MGLAHHSFGIVHNSLQWIVFLAIQVLVCAPSNVAVDNLVEKLGQSHEKVVRLGHPARTLCTNHMFSLDALLGVCDNYELIQDIRKDMDNILVSLLFVFCEPGVFMVYIELVILLMMSNSQKPAKLKTKEA